MNPMKPLDEMSAEELVGYYEHERCKESRVTGKEVFRKLVDDYAAERVLSSCARYGTSGLRLDAKPGEAIERLKLRDPVGYEALKELKSDEVVDEQSNPWVIPIDSVKKRRSRKPYFKMPS